MAKVNDGIVVENNEGRQQKETSVPEKPKGQSSLARFWSTKERHQIAIAPGENVVFNKHVLLVESEGKVAKLLRQIKVADIREVIDTPFESEAEQARFNKFLNSIVYSGEGNRPTRRGMKMLESLFPLDEFTKIVDKGVIQPDVAILRAVKTKSFAGGI
jgi:hypothetical protein